MKVKIAKKAGFCMGVGLALKKLDHTIAKAAGKAVATLGPIIHNPQVLEEYKQQNVKILQSVDEIHKDMYVVIRAHGIPLFEEEKAKTLGAILIDATCPKVKAAQLAVKEATQLNINSHLFLFGEAEHPEVRGLVSYTKGAYTVFSDVSYIDSLIQNNNLPHSLVLAAQTTQDKNIFLEITKKLQNIPDLNFTVLNTICDATKKRQDCVRELAKEVDAFIVIGGKASGNTKRLAEIAASYNIPVYLIESAEELNLNFFQENCTLALTAGASTPKRLIDDVQKKLKSWQT